MRIGPLTVYCALLLAILTPSRAPAAVATNELADMAAQLQYAWYTEQVDEIVALAERLEDETGRGDIGPWLSYYSAYGYYRAAVLSDDDYFGEYIERCEQLSKALVRQDPEFVEALILRGSCAALLASRRPISAVLAPSRAVKSFTKAARLEPENPRLLLQQAIAVIDRPSLRDEFAPVNELLERSLQRFAVTLELDPLNPDWGEAEANATIAALALKNGNRLRARDAAEQALQIVADYRAAEKLLNDLRRSR
ncbi:MAG: hypothetical protein AAGC71_10725 [Pseudomonadota bacterium]